MSQRTDDPGAAGERPWEGPGRVRRDCEPYRGPFLLFLGVVSFLWGIFSWCAGLPAVIALPLGVAVCVMAEQDFAKMRAKVMDPEGARQVHAAFGFALGGAVLGLSGGVFVLAVYLRGLGR